MTKTTKIFVIIVAYNGRNVIGKAINSVIDSSISADIIIVDNASTDETVKFINENYPKVDLILSNKNLGFGKGNNIGIRKALENRADYIFLLNQDAWIEKNTLSELITTHQRNSSFGIISPIHLNENGSKLGWYFSQKINAIDCPGFINDIYFNQLKAIYPIEFIHASGWLLSAECLRKTGLFDPIFPHYGEDNDFALRAKYHGFKIGICTSSRLYHIGKFADNEKKSLDKELYFKFIENLVRLKNINYSLIYLLYQLTFEVINKSLTLLLTRQPGKLKLVFHPYFKVIKQLNKIKKSRTASRQEASFI